MKVLVTGGAGYIGSHAALRLLEDGHQVTVIDDLSRGNLGAIDALRSIAQGDTARFAFIHADLSDTRTLSRAFEERGIDAVMHFAALTYVGESVDRPLAYYRVNTSDALGLLHVCNAHNIERFVFSSTAATYGEPDTSQIPIREDCLQRPINPYGHSKLMFESILRDHTNACARAGKPFAFAALRYFNVAGNDPMARIGEDHDPETHLIPICLEAAIGQRPHVTIFGNDYDTPDGTCVRDYVHVSDLIDAHILVLRRLDAARHDAWAFNLGIGRGYSVREVIEASKRVTGVDFEVLEGDRRPGDPSTLYADPARINADLDWHASITSLDQIIQDAWRWKLANPRGYRTSAG